MMMGGDVSIVILFAKSVAEIVIIAFHYAKL
jgi:hypothetical protein